MPSTSARRLSTRSPLEEVQRRRVQCRSPLLLRTLLDPRVSREPNAQGASQEQQRGTRKDRRFPVYPPVPTDPSAISAQADENDPGIRKGSARQSPPSRPLPEEAWQLPSIVRRDKSHACEEQQLGHRSGRVRSWSECDGRASLTLSRRQFQSGRFGDDVFHHRSFCDQKCRILTARIFA